MDDRQTGQPDYILHTCEYYSVLRTEYGSALRNSDGLDSLILSKSGAVPWPLPNPANRRTEEPEGPRFLATPMQKSIFLPFLSTRGAHVICDESTEYVLE